MNQERVTVVTRKGQITVPVQIRRALQINEGDRLAVSIRNGDDGEVVLRPVRSVVEATYGVAAAGEHRADAGAAREVFEQGLAEDAMHGVNTPDDPA